MSILHLLGTHLLSAMSRKMCRALVDFCYEWQKRAVNRKTAFDIMLITVLPKNNNTRHRSRKSEGVVDASLSIGRTSRASNKMSKLYSSQEAEGVETFPGRGNSK